MVKGKGMRFSLLFQREHRASISGTEDDMDKLERHSKGNIQIDSRKTVFRKLKKERLKIEDLFIPIKEEQIVDKKFKTNLNIAMGEDKEKIEELKKRIQKAKKKPLESIGLSHKFWKLKEEEYKNEGFD